MPRMIELMKQSAVSANVMRSAAKGAVDLPAAEIIEVLVYLTSTPLFGEQARMTLAGWDEAACLAVCSNPASPRAVLDYFAAPRNRRPRLVPALLENPSVPEPILLEMAQEQSRESVRWLLSSARVRASRNALHALVTNPLLTPAELDQVKAALAVLGETAPADSESIEIDEYVLQFIAEHAAEIAAEEGKAFQLIGGTDDEPQPAEAAAGPVPTGGAPSMPGEACPEHRAQRGGGGLGGDFAAAAPKPDADEKISPLQKISRLTVGQRVQLAMKGNREERFILVRDGSKVVSSAVLESPKLTDQEIEMFASLKNVQESVLRGIAGKRKFMKTYGVVRALANNPRCPLDVQLTIIKNLLNQDLRAVSMNKNVSETVRKVALKMFKERTEKKSGLG